jgi:hypothetical protein
LMKGGELLEQLLPFEFQARVIRVRSVSYCSYYTTIHAPKSMQMPKTHFYLVRPRQEVLLTALGCVATD